jgi:excinuclease ABC subunit B
MSLFTLKSNYNPSPDQQIAIDSLTNNIHNGDDRQVMLGVTGSGKTFVMANVIANLNRPAMILSHNKTLAAQLFEEFKEYFPDNAVKYFVSYYDYYQPEAYIPSRDLYIEKESDVNKQIEKFRLSAMNAAVSRRDTIVVASVSCIYNIGDPRGYENHTLTLKIGQKLSMPDLFRNLTFMQYARSSTDFDSAMFRVKGDIVDIFVPYEDYPVRLEFFGDTIERISRIEPITAHRLGDLQEIEVFPAKSIIVEKEVIAKAVEQIRSDLNQQVMFLKNIHKELEAQRLEQRTRYDIEMLEQVGYCKGMENYSIYFENRKSGTPPYTLLDYFPKDYLLFVDESHITMPQVGGMSGGDRSRKATLIDYGFRLPSARDNRPLSFNEFRERQGNTVYVSATPDEWELKESGNVVELLTRPTGLLDPIVEVRPTENQIDDVINEVKKIVAKKQRVLVTTLTKKMAEDLSAYLAEMGVKVNYLHSDIDTVERVDILRDLRLGVYDVLVGINLLREGIDLPEVSLVVILDADKEGFLRSRTSLVQTMGRAARHQEGRVILYADKETDSMKYAISETRRRRAYQEEYNAKYGITPSSIIKAIRGKLVEEDENATESGQLDYVKLVAESKPPVKDVKKLIKELEDKMFVYAENLEFEKAAEIRDQVDDLKELISNS